MENASRPAIKIRAAVASDELFLMAEIARIAEYGETTWRDCESMVATDTKVLQAAFTGQTPGSVILIAENAARVALGFIHLTPEWDYYSQQIQGHVGDLVVAKQGEGQGIGAALLQAGEAWARERGFQLLTLNVFVQNTRAQKLYERMGFDADMLRYAKPLSNKEQT